MSHHSHTRPFISVHHYLKIFSILIFLISLITLHLLKLLSLRMLGTNSSCHGRMYKLESIGDTSPPLVLVLGLTVRSQWAAHCSLLGSCRRHHPPEPSRWLGVRSLPGPRTSQGNGSRSPASAAPRRALSRLGGHLGNDLPTCIRGSSCTGRAPGSTPRRRARGT